MIALDSRQKNLLSVEPLDKSGSLDFIQQAQVPVVFFGQTLGLRVINRDKIDEKNAPTRDWAANLAAPACRSHRFGNEIIWNRNHCYLNSAGF